MASSKIDTTDRELRITKTLDAPVEQVWEAWINPQYIAEWWGPNGFTNTITKMIMEPGGEWDLVMHGPDGTDYVNKSTFKELTPLKKIVYDHVSSPGFVATIEFEAMGEQTLMNWRMLFKTPEQCVQIVEVYGAGEGLKQTIERLNQYVKR